MRYKVAYIGNLYNIAEYIFFHQKYELTMILYEKNRLSDELLTFSYINNITLNELETPLEIENYKEKNDFFIMCSYGRKIPTTIVSLCEIYNIHYGLLPYYKGRHPSYFAFLNNEKYLGITLHIVGNEIDGGSIISSFLFENKLYFNEETLFDSQLSKTNEILNILYNYKKGLIKTISNAGGNYYPPVTEENTIINLQEDSIHEIFNKCKAQARYGGAKLYINNLKDLIYIKFVELSVDKLPSTLNTIDDEQKIYKFNNILFVKKGKYILKLYMGEKY